MWKLIKLKFANLTSNLNAKSQGAAFSTSLRSWSQAHETIFILLKLLRARPNNLDCYKSEKLI